MIKLDFFILREIAPIKSPPQHNDEKRKSRAGRGFARCGRKLSN